MMIADGGGAMYCGSVGDNQVVVSHSEQPQMTEQVIRQCDVTVHDVLLGRGRGPNMHPGNQRYREIIYANRENYNKASNRTEQTRITREIVNHIKQNGRFLKRLEVPKSQKKKKKRGDNQGDSWVVVSDATARLKVGQVRTTPLVSFVITVGMLLKFTFLHSFLIFFNLVPPLQASSRCRKGRW